MSDGDHNRVAPLEREGRESEDVVEGEAMGEEV